MRVAVRRLREMSQAAPLLAVGGMRRSPAVPAVSERYPITPKSIISPRYPARVSQDISHQENLTGLSVTSPSISQLLLLYDTDETKGYIKSHVEKHLLAMARVSAFSRRPSIEQKDTYFYRYIFFCDNRVEI